MKVSVIIPTNKRHSYLLEAIESAQNQTYQNIEIIVVNDGGGGELTEWLGLSCPDVKVVSLEKNVGPGLARNAGVENCSGEFVAFLDSDDKWLENKIEKQIEFAKENPDSKCFHCGLSVFDESGVKAVYVNKPLSLKPKDVLIRGHVLPSSMFLDRSVYLKYGGYSKKYRIAEDYDLILRLVKGGERIKFLPDSLVLFRRMQQGNISSNWQGIWEGKKQLYKDHKVFFRDVGGEGYYFSYYSNLFSECASKSKGLTRIVFRFCSKIYRIFS